MQTERATVPSGTDDVTPGHTPCPGAAPDLTLVAGNGNKEKKPLRGRDKFRADMREAGRVPGGNDSREWLIAHGYWSEDGGRKPLRALQLIQAHFPGFRWEEKVWVEEKKVRKEGGYETMQIARSAVVYTNYPTIDGRYASLADLVQACLAKEAGSQPRWKFDIVGRARHVVHLQPLSHMDHPVGRELAEVMLECGFAMPPTPVVYAMRGWLERGFDRDVDGATHHAEPLTLVSCWCPDYGWKLEEDGRKVYSFEGVGDGIGIVASRVLEALPQLYKVLAHHGVDVHVYACAGDFEADSERNLQRVGVGREEFLVRLARSALAFERAFERRAGLGSQIRTPMFTDLPRGGRADWLRTLAEAEAVIEADLRHVGGPLALTESDIVAILNARKPLYERWENRALTDDEVRAKFKGQAPEYMAMGRIIEDRFRNPLIIQGDALPMATCFQGLPPAVRPAGRSPVRPVIYLKRDAY